MSCTETEAVVAEVRDGIAVVRVTQAPSSCGRCGEAGGCGKATTGASRQYELPNAVGAKAGDRVVLSVPGGAVLRAAMLAYLLPAVLAIAGAAAATALVGDGVPALAGALCGLLAGALAMRRTGRTGPAAMTMRLGTTTMQGKDAQE